MSIDHADRHFELGRREGELTQLSNGNEKGKEILIKTIENSSKSSRVDGFNKYRHTTID